MIIQKTVSQFHPIENETMKLDEQQQTYNLKTLAQQVLARNQKIDLITGNPKIANVDFSEKDLNISVVEIKKQAGEDWEWISSNSEILNSFTAILQEQQLMRSGKIPKNFTVYTFCDACQKQVPVPPALANNGKVLGCPWCHIKISHTQH